MSGAGRVLRVDIPQLDVGGACAALVGRLRGEPRGFVLLPSLAALAEVERAASQDWTNALGQPDFGSRSLLLTFGRREALPKLALREWAAHRWPVGRATAHPWLERRERDGSEGPVTELDLRVAAACATSLGTFFAKYGDRLGNEGEPICESFFDASELEVCLTHPYEAFELFEAPFRRSPRAASPEAGERSPAQSGEPASRGGAQVGRNDPCPCGSGRKYKRCCFAADRERGAAGAGAGAPGERAAVHERDEALVLDLLQYGARRFGPEVRGFAALFGDFENSLQLAMPWAVYGFLVRGRPIVDWYLDERGKRLPAADRAWLEAQQASWLSIWEVVHVEPGACLELVDQLSGERREVREVSASRSLVVRDTILARVVDDLEVPVLCGVHPRALPPTEADEVVRRARRGLRRRGKVPLGELRDGLVGRRLIELWEAAVEELDRRVRVPPNLANTDGEPFLLTTDQFAITAGAEAEVAERLALLPGIERSEPRDSDTEPPEFTFSRPGNRLHASWENTILGRAWIARRVLHVESNSRERADRLRALVEGACEGRIRHRGRGHVDPLSEKVATERAGRELPEPPAELAPVLLELKRRHYADWADQPLPALAGKTPRQAVRSPAGRRQVDLLLREMENHEERSGDSARFDFSPLRRELALGE